MRQRLLALAVAVIGAGAGTVLLVDWDTGQVVDARPGAFEFLDRSACSQSACGASLCVQANDVLADAGSACTTRFGTCDFRVGARARAWAADAGLTLGPSRYQRLRLVGLRCPAVDGGFAFGVPMDDAGMPQFASVTQLTPLCVRAPLDGGTDCKKLGAEVDGGARFIGTGNVFPAAAAAGAQCEPVACSVFFGDDPSVDL